MGQEETERTEPVIDVRRELFPVERVAGPRRTIATRQTYEIWENHGSHECHGYFIGGKPPEMATRNVSEGSEVAALKWSQVSPTPQIGNLVELWAPVRRLFDLEKVSVKSASSVVQNPHRQVLDGEFEQRAKLFTVSRID